MIEAAANLKDRAALSVAYGAGLRASEVIALKVGDIDSQRMVLRVEQGKGHKDCYAMLPPVLLERLRARWRHAHAQGKMLEGGWLFPGQNPIDPCHAGGDARKEHAHGQSRRFRYLEVAPDVSVQRLAHGPLRRLGPILVT